jgi:uncharacterized protein (TIGR00725 family)
VSASVEVAVESYRQWKIAVLGSASVPEGPATGKAFQVGQAVARKGCILLTGACAGLPHEAVLGASSAGGITVGISPALSREEHISVYSCPVDSRIILFTGMGPKGRNVVLVRSADACIFVGGGMGTLNEFTIAYDELGPECALGVLRDAGGFSNEYERLASLSSSHSAALLVVDRDPQVLVEKVVNHIRRHSTANSADMTKGL